MYEKTSSFKFKKYGSVYNESKHMKVNNYVTKKVVTTSKIISTVYNYSDTVYVEMIEGMGYILISDSKNKDFKLFGIHRNLEIKPNMYFNIISITQDFTFNLIMDNRYRVKIEFLNDPYVYNRILPTINISEIMSYYYTIKSPNYKFKGEKHNIYELTFVDNGRLDTNIEGIDYTLNACDLIIYGKNQFHTQMVNSNTSCSYLTVLFDMVCDDDSLICNRIFHCKKDIYDVMKKFVKNLSATMPYSKNLILVNFNELIIKLFQYNYLNNENDKIPKETYQQFQNELLNDILQYIEKTICEPITIDDICSKFALSRSSLQILFKNNLNMPPKKYINNLKLAKSKLLIKENKYTISEISIILGFSSIHYFSRAFSQYYKISPSEYAQTIFN